jgi:8-oxo-dGTP pyrophosphatase MutT (NUDIX family)
MSIFKYHFVVIRYRILLEVIDTPYYIKNKYISLLFFWKTQYVYFVTAMLETRIEKKAGGMINITQTPRYRASSLCIIWKADSILLEQFPTEDGVTTFRPVGGTIEYGEDSRSAVIREVKEELNLDVTDTKLLGIIENIFPYYRDIGHEFDFIYEAKFLHSAAYEQHVIHGVEGKNHFIAVWKRLADFKEDPNIKLVPDGLYQMLTSQGNSESINDIKHINTKDILEFWAIKS